MAGGCGEGAGSNALIQTGWRTLALLADHIPSRSYQVLEDGILEIHDLQLYMKHGSQNYFRPSLTGLWGYTWHPVIIDSTTNEILLLGNVLHGL